MDNFFLTICEKNGENRDQIELENTDLEKTIVELENYLRHLDEVATTGSAEDNEWKTRYEIQKAHDLHLADHKAWLEAELAETEWKLHTGSYPDAMNCNLDLLTELELVRLVKHMERIKNDYYTSVCDTDYKTEKETKVYRMKCRSIISKITLIFLGRSHFGINSLIFRSFITLTR